MNVVLHYVPLKLMGRRHLTQTGCPFCVPGFQRGIRRTTRAASRSSAGCKGPGLSPSRPPPVHRAIGSSRPASSTCRTHTGPMSCCQTRRRAWYRPCGRSCRPRTSTATQTGLAPSPPVFCPQPYAPRGPPHVAPHHN